VVGINSFQPNEPYKVLENAGIDHVVFQFQNTPVMRRMNETNTNDGGYALSEMREYLAGVDGEDGNFLAGLKTAGVPEDVLWGPVRYIANVYNGTPEGTDALTDLLWLPTEREMTGSRTSSFAEETEENQAQLKYYIGKSGSLIKATPAYWRSSPSGGSAFCSVAGGGGSHGNPASNVLGVAPAFCVR
jgi:hypothetical protein